MIRWIALAIFFAIGVASAPAAAGQAPQLPSAVAELRTQDARVLTLGYRLKTGNARYCQDATSTAGLLLHDMALYKDGETLRRILGLGSDVGVQALVSGGPAERAGVRIDDTVIAIGTSDVADFALEDGKPWTRIEAIRAETERLLDETGSLSITVLRGTGPIVLDIEGVPACRSRFEIGDDSRAVADGHRVVIGSRFVGIDYPDPLLAAVLAHEMSHNLLRHRAWFDANGGRKQKAVRLTEREADRLSPWLLANAGFDPRAGAEFFSKWGPVHGGWIFRARSHDGWDERVEFIEAEIAEMETLGSTDWSQHFVKEKLPGKVRVAGR
ncbi:hypothetical protein [Alteriqipengyuania sp.]|uniref:hypothetical protein n=1 Tax=Alteriqipengyuania sp. TaxID=2800692 RepID=UPI0035179F95